MNTIATWFEPKKKTSSSDSTPENVELDLHLNFWKLYNTKSKKQEYLLDLGFMISDICKLSTLNIYFPFEVDLNDLEDIGGRLNDNHGLISAIFNENYQVQDDGIVKQRSIQNDNGEKQFNTYAIDFRQTDYVTLAPCCEGAKLSISLEKIQTIDHWGKYYFRFRLKGQSLLKFRRQHKPKVRHFQSGFTATETIDIRVNEKRNYHPSLREEIKSQNEFHINKIHFLLLRHSSDDFESQHIDASCRELEPELWRRYAGKDYNLKDIVAYHWSKKGTSGDGKGVGSFNTLIKIKYNEQNLRTILSYLAILWGLAILFNVSSSYTKECLDSQVFKRNIIKENVTPGKAPFSATDDGKSVTLDIKVKVRAIKEGGDE